VLRPSVFTNVGAPAMLLFAICAAAYVGWFAVVDRWLGPWWQGLVGRMLGVRIENTSWRVGFLETRMWAAVPPTHEKAATVVIMGVTSTLALVLCPSVATALIVTHVRLSPHWSATLTLMSVIVCPIGIVALAMGAGTAPRRTQEVLARFTRGDQPPPRSG
jgi:hypothetical protein